MKWLALLGLLASACVDQAVAVELGATNGVMEIGPQGGFHLWLDLHVSGHQPTAVISMRTVDDVDVVMMANLPAAPVQGYAAIVCPAPADMNLVDRSVRVQVEVTDASGGFASDERMVTLRCPTDHPDVLTTCRRICDRRVE